MPASELYKRLHQAKGLGIENLPTICSDILDAHQKISQVLSETPLQKSVWLSELIEGEVWLKLESLNPNGSFKVRGALNAVSNFMASKALKKSGSAEKIKICAASAGNHAQGVAFAARHFGCEAHIFLPRFAPLVKRMATEKLGAKIYLVGESIEDSFLAALRFAEANNAFFIHAFNDYDVIIGQATCAYETLLQLRRLKNDPKFAPDFFMSGIGGGGLLAGASLLLQSLAPSTKIVGIEQEYYDSALRSIKAQEQLPCEKKKATIADGVAVSQIGNLNFDYLRHSVEKVTTVSDDLLSKAILGLSEQEHVIAEGAGALSVAEILQDPCYYKNKTVVACISGGNVDPQILSRIIARGLHITGRVLKVTVCVNDKPGGLNKLLEHVATMEGNVIDLIHDRTYSKVSVGEVDVELSLETRNSEHQYVLIEKLEEAGFKPRVRI